VSLQRTVADFFALSQGASGAPRALTAGAVALCVLGVATIPVGAEWCDGAHDDVHSNTPHSDYCDTYTDHCNTYADTPHDNTHFNRCFNP